MPNTNNGDATNNQLFDWLRKNIIAILMISAGVIAGYVRLDSQVNALDRRGTERTAARDAQIAEINAQVEAIKQSYVTRTELNQVVGTRLDRIEDKLDRVIEKSK